MIPPLSFSASASSSAKSGDATQGLNSNAGEMNINYGSGVSQGGGISPMAIYAALAIAAVYVWKRST